MIAADATRSLPYRVHVLAFVRGAVAAAIVATIGFAYSLSFAAVIFSGPLSPGLSYGFGAALLSAAIVGVTVAWRSSFPSAIGGPDTPVMAVVGGLASAAAAAGLGGDDLVAGTLALISTTTFAIGLVLLTVGTLRLTRWLRFIPVPVVGGFVTASGWLLIVGAVRLLTGTDAAPAALLATPFPVSLVAGVAMAATAGIVRWWWPAAGVLAVVIAGAVLAFHVVLAVAGIPIATARAEGWLLPDAAVAALWLPPAEIATFESLDAGALLAVLPAALVVIGVATIALYLNLSSLELILERDGDVDGDFRAAGLANVLAGVAGALPGHVAQSRTVLNDRCAGGRWAGALAALLCAVPLAAQSNVIGLVPIAVPGGVLLYLGTSLLWRWLISARHQLPRSDYLLLIVIFALTLVLGYLEGVVVGLLIACVSFALSYARVPVVRRAATRASCTSYVSRDSDAEAYLIREGHRLQLLRLQGYVFFGSVTALADRVRAITIRAPVERRARWLVLDLAEVTGIDGSGWQSLRRLAQLTTSPPGFVLAVAAASAEIEPLLAAEASARPGTFGVRLFANADDALEAGEEALLSLRPANAVPTAISFEAWLAHDLGDPGGAVRLARHCRIVEVPPGTHLCRQGEPADSLYFLVEGRLTVLLDATDPPVRLRTMLSRTLVGEMGFFRGEARSASIRADAPSLVYAIDRATVDTLRITDPAAVAALQAFVVRVLADRLAFANSELSALQR